ncbi:hypothetical protein CRENBAI_011578 [Crenichthys baileyi]|uniref:Uncharacterized protein n=1 Tax=Crenichthys baileyi TaxID=28760 RepID=A0AAV9SQF1_9TELE
MDATLLIHWSRRESSPLQKEMGSRAYAVRGGEPDFSSRYLSTSRKNAPAPFPPQRGDIPRPQASLSIRGGPGAEVSALFRHPIPFCTRTRLAFPGVGGAPGGMALRLSFRLGPAGSREEQPGHQALSGESRPQAWLQGGTPAPPYRATSRASIY